MIYSSDYLTRQQTSCLPHRNTNDDNDNGDC